MSVKRVGVKQGSQWRGLVLRRSSCTRHTGRGAGVLGGESV